MRLTMVKSEGVVTRLNVAENTPLGPFCRNRTLGGFCVNLVVCVWGGSAVLCKGGQKVDVPTRPNVVKKVRGIHVDGSCPLLSSYL